MAIDWSGYVRDYRKNGSATNNNNNQTTWGNYVKKKRATYSIQRFQKLEDDFYSAQDSFYNNWNNTNDSNAFLTKSKNYYQELQGFYDDLKNNADIYKGVLGDKSYSKTYNSLGDVLKNKDNADKYITSQSELYKKYQNADEYNKAKKQATYLSKYNHINTVEDFDKEITPEKYSKLDKEEQNYLQGFKFALEYWDVENKIEAVTKEITLRTTQQNKIPITQNDFNQTVEEYERKNSTLNQKGVDLLRQQLSTLEKRKEEIKKKAGDFSNFETSISSMRLKHNFKTKWSGYVDEMATAKDNAKKDAYSMTPTERAQILSGAGAPSRDKRIADYEAAAKADEDPTINRDLMHHANNYEISQRDWQGQSYMEKEEIRLYNFLLGKYGKEKAEEYFQDLSDAYLDQRYNEAMQSMAKEFSKNHPVLGSLLDYTTNLLASPAETALNRISKNGKRTTSTYMSEGYYSGVREKIPTETLKEIADGTRGFLQSVATKFVYGPFGKAAFVLSGFADGYNSSLDKGATQGQAAAVGLASGLAEVTFESLSLGQLKMFKDAKTTLKGLTKSQAVKKLSSMLAKTTFVNWSEETVTEVANLLAEDVFLEELSDYAFSVEKYYAEGASEEEAKAKATNDMKRRIDKAGRMGAIGGFFGGIGGSTKNYYIYNQTNKIVGNVVSQNKDNITTLKEIALQSDSVPIIKASEKLTTKSSAADVGAVYNALEEHQTNQTKKQLEKALLRNGATESGSNSAKGWANQIIKTVTKKNVDDASAIDEMLRVNQVTSKVYSDFIDKGKYGGNILFALDSMIEPLTDQLQRGKLQVLSNDQISENINKDIADKNEIREKIRPTFGTNELPASLVQRGPITNIFKQNVANKLEAERPSPKAKTEADVQAEKQAYFDKYFAKEKQITPEEEEHLKEFGESKGLEVEFVDGAVNDIGYGVFKNGKKIVISRYAKQPMRILFKHEFTHSVENAKGYKSFQEYVLKESQAFKEWLATKGFEDDSAAIKDMMERYKGKVDYNKKGNTDNTDSDNRKDNNYEKAKADVIADFVGEVLFGKNIDKNRNPIKIDTNFLVELKRKDRNLFYRFVDWVHSIFQRLKASGVVNKDIIRLEQKFKRLAEQSVREREKTEGKQITTNKVEKAKTQKVEKQKSESVEDEKPKPERPRRTDKKSLSYKPQFADVAEAMAETDGQYLLPDKYADYDKPITAKDIEVLRSIGRKSINKFEPEDLVKAQKWAYKFYQQLGEKSPFFRAWFGDWRAYDIKNKIPVINKSTAKTFKAGKAENVDTGRYISWGDQIKGETKIKYGTESDVYGFLENIEEIVKNSILLDTNVSVLSSKHKMDNTEFMHSMYSIIEDKDGNECLIKLLVEEAFNDKMTADFSRAYELQEIKKVATLHTGVHSNNGGLTRQVTTSYSISELFDFVKQKDKNFNPNPVNKHLVNEDGTPKKFYHGTKEKFTEFSKKKAKPGFYGRGFYFTTEKSQSNVYGESMEVFLKIENPLMPGETKITKNQIIKFLEAVADNEDYSIENYGTYDVNEIANRITNRDAFDVIQDINATAIGDFGEAMQLFNEVNNTNFDGVITPTETVVYDNTKIKSAEKGTPKANIGTFDKTEGDIRYSLPQLDAEYMRYVDSWNKESAQKMVDNAAKEAGAILDENGNPLKLYRGTMGGQTVFKKETTLNGKIYTIDNIDIATNYGDKSGKATEIAHQIEGEKTTYALYGFPKKMLTIDANYGVWSDLVVPEELLKYSDGRYKATNAEIAEWAEKEGYDALKIDNVRDGSFDAGSEIIFFNENLVKSADAITKDNNGNVISLSERFNTENADIRYSLPDDGYAPTFYSKMGKTVDEMKQDKIGANSVVSYLTGRGVKSEEIKWSGIETFLEGKKSVTKAELQEFIAGSQLQIEENVLGKDTFKEFFDAMSDATDIHITRQQFAKYIQESDGEYNKIAQLLEWTNVSEEKKQDVLSKYKKAVENFGKDVAKWEEYKLDGGENYREITFKMPNSTYTNGAMQAHWGVAAEGILAHARLQDFNVDGKKMLFVEEIQSDWHNMGHKKGYREKGRKTAREIYLESQEAYKDFYKTVSKMLDDKGISYNPVVIANFFAGENVGFNFLNGLGEVKKLTDEEIQYIKTESQKEKNRQQAMDTAPGYDSVPDAPFKDNYHEYVLKRLIRMAAEEGYDSIGWTPADIQSERWSDEFAEGYRIEYDQDIPKFLKKYGKQWGATVGKTYLGDATQKKASYVISTDIGNDGQYYSTIEEAVEALIENTNENFGTDFSADSVDIDEWDDVVRVFDEETGDEIGTLHTEYGTADSRGVTEVWSMDITDQMKNSVLYEGQALYSLPNDSYNIPEIARGKNSDELRTLVDEGKITKDDAMAELSKQFGRMPQGESPKVDVTVPNKVSERQGVRRFARTALESGHLTEGMSEEAKREILDGALNYKILSNNMLVNMAENEVKNDINKAIKKWEDLVNSGRMPTAKEIVLGEVLMVEAAKAGNANDVAMYLAELSAMGTELGQGIQALSLLKKLSGVGQLHYVSRVIAQLNEDLKSRYGDKYLDKMVKLNPYQEKMLAESKNESEIESIIDDILTDVARQLPSTWRDKLNAWRYLAMLGNVKTHLRNFLGNGVFMPAIRLKNTLASVAEKIIIRDETNRTKSFKLKKEYKDFAEADFKNVEDLISKGGKMSPSSIVDERRKIFTSKAFGWLENARQFNFNMLEKEDLVFLKHHYKVALASVLQSRGINLNNVTEEQLQSARNYAIKEAQKATYRDFSYFANVLNKLANPNKNGNGWDALRSVGGVLVEGAVPFKKTPINVLKRGVEYSPIGIATSLANAAMAAKRGEFSGAELIDGLSAGMSGTMILGLGMLLQSLGIITGGLGYDDDDALERMSGAQPYSLNFGEVISDLAGVVGIDADVDNYSLTIDWMAPSSLPLLIGAEIQKANEEAENYNLLDALATIGEPMTELSFLQGISDVIDGIAYSGKDSLGKIGEPLTNLVSSYLSQYIPTLSGQTARTLDDTRRTNFIDKDSAVPKSIQKVWQKTLGKIPFAANEKVPYIDAWGKVDKEDNALLRAFENFLSPTYISKIEDDKVNKELAKVYADTKDSSIIPKRASTSFEVNGKDKFLTPEEYVKYATNRGQYSRQYIETIMGNSMYKGLSSENKAEAISFLLSFADAKAKGDVSDYDYATERSFKSAAKFEMAGIDVTSYAIAKAAMRKENADTDGSDSVDKDERKEALEKAGFNRRERNNFLDIYYSNYEDILDNYGE